MSLQFQAVSSHFSHQAPMFAQFGGFIAIVCLFGRKVQHFNLISPTPTPRNMATVQSGIILLQTHVPDLKIPRIGLMMII